MTMTAASPFLADCTVRFAANAARIESLSALSAERANRSPAAGWSVAQCLDHATKSVELYLPFMQGALSRARDRGAVGEAGLGRGTAIGRMILGSMDPDRRKPMRLRAPKVFRPQEGGIDWTVLLDRARAAHAELRTIAESAEGLDIDRARLRTPVAALVRVSLAQALRIHAIHVARHLDQADRVLAERGADSQPEG